MARKSKGRRMQKGGQEETDEDDTRSVVSGVSAATGWSEDDGWNEQPIKSDTEGEGMEQDIENLTEKRSATRIAALGRLHGALLQYMPPDDISATFVDNVLACLHRPSEKEAVEASKVLSVLALIFGPEEEEFYQRVRNVLEPLATKVRSVAARAAALRALAIVCFVCSIEVEDVDEMLNIFENGLGLKNASNVIIAALESWGLIASGQSHEALADDAYVRRFMPRFVALLDHAEVDVRASAGENIALLFESSQQCGVSLPMDEMITDKIRAMAKDSSKRNSKKDRRTQRSVFRDVCATLEDGESPTSSFSIKNDVIDISSWKSVKQFEAVKDALQTGLQEHLKYNNALRQMLSLPEMHTERATDRRDVFDKKSQSRKQRANELKDDRRRKQNLQDTFYGDD